jgi:hypothetical protein
MYRVIVQYDKSWRRFLGRRWRVVDQWKDPSEYYPVIKTNVGAGFLNYNVGISIASHKKRIVGARCNPLEILKEWQAWRRKQ